MVSKQRTSKEFVKTEVRQSLQKEEKEKEKEKVPSVRTSQSLKSRVFVTNLIINNTKTTTTQQTKKSIISIPDVSVTADSPTKLLSKNVGNEKLNKTLNSISRSNEDKFNT